MVEATINLWAVLAAAVTAMIIGSLWYSPMLFYKPWLAALRQTEAEIKAQTAGMAYLVAMVGSLITAYVLAHFISFVGATDVWAGALTGFWIWLGFIVTMMTTGALFENRPLNLVFINATNSLVTLLVMGAILGAWL